MTEADGSGQQLSRLLAEAGLKEPSDDQTAKFEAYLELILKWNARMNLTAVRDRVGILSRHFVESIACAHVLPEEIRSVLDFGSGAGFPGVPIAICRPELSVTLAESQAKKAAFLNEVVREVGLRAQVFAGRAEAINREFDCVVLRAVDRMGDAIGLAANLVAESGWIVVMSMTETRTEIVGAHPEFCWDDVISLPGSERRVVLIGRRA